MNILIGPNSNQTTQNHFKSTTEYISVLQYGDIYNNDFKNQLNYDPDKLIRYIEKYLISFIENLNQLASEPQIEINNSTKLTRLTHKMEMIRFFINKIIISIRWYRDDNNNLLEYTFLPFN